MVLLFLVLIIPAGIVSAQKLLDIYKNGPVKLVADKTYGAKNNWESLFNLYYDTISTYDRPGGNEKKIVVAPDGSVFMSHKNRHEIWKFGPDGNFIKSFGSKGGKAHQFPMLPTIQPVVEGKYIFTCDVNARIKFFDLDGNYYKSITLDYMPGNFQPIGNGKILLYGRVLWRKQEPGTNDIIFNNRNIVVNLDMNTGKEKIIYDYFDDYSSRYTKTTDKDTVQKASYSPPPVKIYMPPPPPGTGRPVITFLPDGRFIKSDRRKGEMKVFDITGKEIKNFNLNISPIAVTEEDAKENYERTKQSILKSIERINASPNLPESGKQRMLSQNRRLLDSVEKYKDLKNYNKYLPYFSNVILDDEGNILVFEYTSREEKQSNIFNVIAYDSNGQKLARTSFICDDYDLSFSDSKFVISKGYVYAVARLKNTTGMPLRLVKFKITN